MLSRFVCMGLIVVHRRPIHSGPIDSWSHQGNITRKLEYYSGQPS